MARIVFVERRKSESVSIERVFRQVVNDLPGDEFEVSFANVPYGNGITAIIKNLLTFRRPNADIYHITGDIHYMALRLPAGATILTIHDLIFLHRRSGIRRFVLKKLFLDLPLRRLRYITAVSETTKEEIIRFTGVDANRITVIQNPLPGHFEPGKVKRFNEQCPVILQIGTAENKNLAKLIEAVHGLRCKLRIIGTLDNNTVEHLMAYGIAYDNAVGLDQSQIVEEYRNADILSYCSTYEGFGLPILEAQAMCKPVLTSNIAPMNAVAGDGAVLVDPHNAASIREGLMSIISDENCRDRLIRAGTVNVKRFDGTTIAHQYAGLYRSMLDG